MVFATSTSAGTGGIPNASELEALSESEVSAAFRGPPHAFIDVGHSRLAYWRFGRGPDVVFVHGWPLHSATFRRIAPGLCDTFSCHFVDLPGAGKTEWSAQAPINMRSHASTVRRAIDELGIARYALVAHDSGATVARLVAADDPRVAGLVLGNTEIPGHRPWLLQVFGTIAKLPGGAAIIGGLMRMPAVQNSSIGFKACFTDPDYAKGEFSEIFLLPLLKSKRAASGQMRLLEGIDWKVIDGLADVQRRIRAPVRLIWGADDPIFLAAEAKGMLEQFAGIAELFEIPGAKVFCHEDHPSEFVAYAKPFLESCLA
jgi:pimeloyl-ACP methyl ester carboxylesterase